MKTWIKAAIATAAVTVILAVGGPVASSRGCCASMIEANGGRKRLPRGATDFSARRHYRRYYRHVYRPHYYARPYYYRPYPYYAPAPFPFGFGFGPRWCRVGR